MADNVIVSVMPSSGAAYDLVDALKKNDDDKFKVKTGAIVRKDERGNVEYLDEKDRPLWGTLGGAAIGTLVGALAGPGGAAIGAVLGGSTGLIGDAVVSADDDDYADKIVFDMDPGSAALIVEADEGNPKYFDNLAEEYGGVVYR